MPGALACSWRTRSGWPCRGRWRCRCGSLGTLARQPCAGQQALAPDAHLHWTGLPRCRGRSMTSAGASSPREGLRPAEASPLHHAHIHQRDWQTLTGLLLMSEAYTYSGYQTRIVCQPSDTGQVLVSNCRAPSSSTACRCRPAAHPAINVPELPSSERMPSLRLASSSLNCSRKRPLYFTVFQPSSAFRAGFTSRFRKMLNALGDSKVMVLPPTCASHITLQHSIVQPLSSDPDKQQGCMLGLDSFSASVGCKFHARGMEDSLRSVYAHLLPGMRRSWSSCTLLSAHSPPAPKCPHQSAASM